MKNLIISTIPENHEEIKDIQKDLKAHLNDVEFIFTDKMKIEPCKGCTSCWLITPGTCPIKDDYEEQILKRILKADHVIYISQAKYGFVTHETKNLFDRILSLLTMYLRIYHGEMRHVSRYNKT